jgi:hypothetical protein
MASEQERKMPNEASDYVLWVHGRTLENAMRFLNDVYLGLIREIKAVNPGAQLPDINMPSLGNDPIGPKPPCQPPLCFRSVDQLRQITNRVGQATVEFADNMDLFYDLAEELGIEMIHFQPGVLPLPPEGSVLNGVERSRRPLGTR